MNLRLHIERLVLDGLPVAGGDSAGLQAAVAAELERLLAAEFSPPETSCNPAQVAGAPMHLPPHASARALGREIGRSVFAGLYPGAFVSHTTTQTNKGK